MVTIVEPKEHIDKLWSKQRIRDEAIYRMMRYVLLVNHDNKVLLHNVVTGQLVVLDEAEKAVLDELPIAYTPMIEQLVTEHYLVPEDYDEHQQVANLQSVLRRLTDARCSDAITKYTILPTTACNARCYYCFERGVKPLTMTERTVDDVVDFIDKHCGEKRRVHLSWFGGEPTLAARRIDQICEGLQDRHIQYWSDMTTNGYLFDQDMVKRAVSLWHLKSVMICVDGTEESYNKTKAYVDAKENPYQRVMRNIELFLGQEVRVNLRMNFDLVNYSDFFELAKEVKCRFQNNSLLKFHVHPVVGNHADHTGQVRHGSDEWFSEKTVELNDFARRVGLLKDDTSLPFLQIGCQAASDSTITINADGMLAKCPEQFGDNDGVGDLIHGVTNTQLVQSWKKLSDFQPCVECDMFPACAKINRCSARERCNFCSEIHRIVYRAVCRWYDGWKDKNALHSEGRNYIWYSKNPGLNS